MVTLFKIALVLIVLAPLIAVFFSILRYLFKKADPITKKIVTAFVLVRAGFFALLNSLIRH